jgi:hypothetical protein
MRIEDLEDARHHPLLEDVAPSVVEDLGAFLQRFPAHVELAREGEPADFLHLIVDGQVELFAGHNDRETTVSVIGPAQSFIVAAVLLDRIYLKSARAMVPSRVLLVPADAVRDGFAEDASLARHLAIELSLAYRGLVRDFKKPEAAVKFRTPCQLATGPRRRNWWQRPLRIAIRQEGAGGPSRHGAGIAVAFVRGYCTLSRYGGRR